METPNDEAHPEPGTCFGAICTPESHRLDVAQRQGTLWFCDRDSVYWGHNALVRMAPFREHCRLPALPGKPPLGGAVMSQDIVEAAFMGRAGWEVGWLIEGGGSFDELPANILTYGQRDRRWCQGNFQH